MKTLTIVLEDCTFDIIKKGVKCDQLENNLEISDNDVAEEISNFLDIMAMNGSLEEELKSYL
jgi:hypothetical protein